MIAGKVYEISIMRKMKAYFKYWGKAAKSKEGEEMRYHLLAYHSLDVAAVGRNT